MNDDRAVCNGVNETWSVQPEKMEARAWRVFVPSVSRSWIPSPTVPSHRGVAQLVHNAIPNVDSEAILQFTDVHLLKRPPRAQLLAAQSNLTFRLWPGIPAAVSAKEVPILRNAVQSWPRSSIVDASSLAAFFSHLIDHANPTFYKSVAVHLYLSIQAPRNHPKGSGVTRASIDIAVGLQGSTKDLRTRPLQATFWSNWTSPCDQAAYNRRSFLSTHSYHTGTFEQLSSLRFGRDDNDFIETLSHQLNSNFGTIHPVFEAHKGVFDRWKDLFKFRTDCYDDLTYSAFSNFERAVPEVSCDRVILNLYEGKNDEAVRKGKIDSFTLRGGLKLDASFQKSMKEYQKARLATIGARPHRAFIALGSNEGDSLALIEQACREMKLRGIDVERSGFLYETKPMYLEDQKNFTNTACQVSTNLEPQALLQNLKEIENELGRVKTIDNGPRPIDLDILLFNGQTINSETLVVPHPRMMERDFVLKPLCDLIPHDGLPDTPLLSTFKSQLDKVTDPQAPLLEQTTVSSRHAIIRSQAPRKFTRLMSIMNLTPDSFSDGGDHPLTNTETILKTVKQQINERHAPSIIDIGGQSTRPRAPQISPDEELSRILPITQAIRADPSFNETTISIDTYRSSVARAAIEAGADLINDVSAGQLDPEMLPTVASLGCSIILMHMRGTPDTMTKLTDYPSGIIHGVGTELLQRVHEAEKAGIRRWRILLDPGIGFAKTQAQNLELLRRFDELRDFEGLRGFPWVVGASRKGFIGKITGVEEAKERRMGTAACLVAAIRGGADFVRVHDVEEMGQVAAMADAIYRV